MTTRNDSERYQPPPHHEHHHQQQLQHHHHHLQQHHEHYHQQLHHQQHVPLQHSQQHSHHSEPPPPSQQQHLYHPQQLQQQIDNRSTDVTIGCEQVLLPAIVDSNGATEQTHYVPETDPMSVMFADIGATDVHLEQRNATAAEAHPTAANPSTPQSSQPSQDPITAQQLPKKRKNAIHDTINEDAPANPIETPSENGQPVESYEEEQPTSSSRLLASKENAVDVDQCRVCTTKEDLVSLFKMIDNQTVADMLMTICPSVSIALQDFMPQYICSTCVENVTIAIQLKRQCEKTETELRKKLSRGKNKVRRPTGYIVIDAHVESDPPSDDDDEPNDDEFKVSVSEHSSSSSASSYEGDSDYGYKTKKTSKRGATGGRRGRRKTKFTNSTPQVVKEKKRPGRPPLNRSAPNMYTAAGDNSGGEEEICINANGQIKRMRRVELEYEQRLHEQQQRQQRQQQKQHQQQQQNWTDEEFKCDECPQVFRRKLSLKLHKKSHEVRDPIHCEVCGKEFRVKGAYKTHLEKHTKNFNGFKCEKCGRTLSSRADLKRHMADEHGEAGLIYECKSCGRDFVTETRLYKHQVNRCPGYMEGRRRRYDIEGYSVGKDLFRTVAPVTTTYWSDSFSE